MKKYLSFLILLVIPLFLFLITCPYPDHPLNPTNDDNNDNNKPDKPFLTIINGLSENLSFINRKGEDLFTSNILIGSGPNQLIKNGNDVYIINSLSHSVMVFDYDDFSIKREFSVGNGPNPYKACIIGNKIYISAFLTHKLLIYDLSSSEQVEISFSDEDPYKPYPQGVVNWNNYVFVACMYSKDGGATNTRDPGRVAVYNADTDTLEGYIEASATNTNALYMKDDILYIISSGSYSGGFKGDGKIECINLMDESDALKGSGTLTPDISTVADGSSFGPLCIHGNKAWTGNLGDGRLRQYNITTPSWIQTTWRTFPGSYGLAYIPDIKYDPNDNLLYVTEFNGNYLYILYPDTLATKESFKSTTSTIGDAQFMLMCE